MKKIKLLELFGGIGAPRKALEVLGYPTKSLDYVEILPYAVEAYNQIFNNDYEPESVLGWNMNVDVLIHGSPCVDFSNAGKNDESTGRSILYQRTLEIIEKELNPRPKVVIWENVLGLLSKRHIRHFEHYISTMEKLGYNVFYDTLCALDFGIPQNRKRVFVIAIRNDMNEIFNFNVLNRKPLNPLIDYLEDEDKDLERYDVTQPSMIRSFEKGSSFIAIDYVNTLMTNPIRWNTAVVFKDYDKYYRKSLVGGGMENQPRGCVTLSKIPDVERLDRENPILRYLTEREYFRLMGFTDDDFDRILARNIPNTVLYKLAGNSICVPVLEAIFEELHRLGII